MLANSRYDWYEARFCGVEDLHWTRVEAPSFQDAAEIYAQSEDPAHDHFVAKGARAEVSVRKTSDPGYVELFEVTCCSDPVYSAERID